MAKSIKQTAELRQSGLGGSDMSAVMGVSPYRTAIDVYLEKVGEVRPFEGNDLTWYGHEAEPLVAKYFARRTGLKVRSVKGTVRHPTHPYLMAHPDRLVGSDEGLELKTAGWRQLEEWGLEGTDEVPDEYLVQTHWYNVLCDFKGTHVALLIGRDLMLYYVPRQAKWDELLLNVAKDFWTRYVEPRVMPPVEEWNALAQRAMRKAYPLVDPKTVIVADEAVVKLIARQNELKARAKDTTEELKGLDAALRDYAKNFEYVLLPNGRCLHKIAVAGAQVPAYFREPYTYLREVRAPRGLHIPELKLTDDTQQETSDDE